MATLVSQASRVPSNEKALKIIARSLFKEPKLNGYDSRQIVSLSTELISLVTSDLSSDQSQS